MKLILIGLLVSTQALAGTIVPDILWNKIQPNQTGSAAALNGRNNASLFAATTKSTPDEGSDSHYSNGGIGAMKTFGGFATEVLAYEFDSAGTYTDALFLNAGYLVNPGLSVGTNFLHVKGDGYEYNTLGLSATKKVGPIYVGGGVERETWNAFFPNTTRFYAGVGYMQDKNTTAEVVLSHKPQVAEEVDDSDTVVGADTTLTLSAVHTINKFQITGTVRHTKITTDDSDADENTESSTTSIGAGGEFQINKIFAVGAKLGSRIEEETDNDDSDEDTKTTAGSFGVTGRVNFSQFQVYASLDSEVTEDEYEDGTDDEEETDQTLTVFGTYFF